MGDLVPQARPVSEELRDQLEAQDSQVELDLEENPDRPESEDLLDKLVPEERLDRPDHQLTAVNR